MQLLSDGGLRNILGSIYTAVIEVPNLELSLLGVRASSTDPKSSVNLGLTGAT